MLFFTYRQSDAKENFEIVCFSRSIFRKVIFKNVIIEVMNSCIVGNSKAVRIVISDQFGILLKILFFFFEN